MASKGIVKDYDKEVKDADPLEDVKEALKQTSHNKKTDNLETKEKDYEKQLEEKQNKIEELTDTLKRLQAEFENYKKRVDKEKEEFAKYAGALAIGKLLPVLDSFEHAVKNTTDKEKFAQGIKLIHNQFVSTLESAGLRQIKAEGQQFDPYKHEVLLKEESDKPEGTILEELQKGYMFHDRVLRFSKVKISGK